MYRDRTGIDNIIETTRCRWCWRCPTNVILFLKKGHKEIVSVYSVTCAGPLISERDFRLSLYNDRDRGDSSVSFSALDPYLSCCQSGGRVVSQVFCLPEDYRKDVLPTCKSKNIGVFLLF